MKEHLVAKQTICDDTELIISVVDYGKKHQVSVRLTIDGPGFNFNVDLEDPKDMAGLLEVARIARLGIIAEYDANEQLARQQREAAAPPPIPVAAPEDPPASA